MSIHVSPFPEGRVTRIPAGELVSSHVIGHPKSASAEMLGGSAAINPPASRPETLSVNLGHVGVVIDISASGQAPVHTMHLAGSGPAPAGRVQLQVASPDLSGWFEIFSAGEPHARKRDVAADPVVQRLSRALAAAEQSTEEYGALYADALRLAIVTHLLSAQGRIEPEPAAPSAPTPQPARSRSGLPRWRFKRVEAYIEANLSEAISLADMAAAAGLSRMHFAAQFRVLTGLRPHEFLLRRRIERAQAMMQETRDTLVEIALAVGFQTQSHFTTVFRRFVGQTPYQWRRADRTGN